MMLSSGANHDPSVFKDADKFIPGRENATCPAHSGRSTNVMIGSGFINSLACQDPRRRGCCRGITILASS